MQKVVYLPQRLAAMTSPCERKNNPPTNTIPTSRAKSIPKSHSGKSRQKTSPPSRQARKILSASGSSILPRRETWL